MAPGDLRVTSRPASKFRPPPRGGIETVWEDRSDRGFRQESKAEYQLLKTPVVHGEQDIARPELTVAMVPNGGTQSRQGQVRLAKDPSLSPLVDVWTDLTRRQQGRA